MTSKNSSFSQNIKLMLNTIRRQIWLPTLSMLACFFALPIFTILMIQNSLLDREYLRDEMIYRKMTEIFGFGNEIIVAIVICGAIIAGISTFSYLHNTIKVDFYHSLPLRRTQIFGINVAAAVISSVVPYIINVLLALAAACGLGYASYIDFADSFAAMGLHILFFILIYVFVLLSTQMTGKLILNALLVPYVFLIIPACIGVYELIMNMFYRTHVTNEKMLEWCEHLSPPWFYIERAADGYVEPSTVLWLIGIIIAVGAVSLLLYRRRASETAESALPYSWLRYLIAYPLLTLGTVMFGMAFYGLGNESYAWMIFGFVCGALIISRILEIIIAGDFKAIKKNFRGLLIYAVLFAVFISIPMFDLTKYDAYVPNASKVQSASIQFSSGGYYNDSLDIYYNQNAELRELMTRQEFLYEACEITGQQEINAVLNLAAAGVQQVEYNKDTLRKALYSTYSSKPYINYTIRYTMTNGREVYRSYPQISLSKVHKDVATVFDNEQYRTNQYKCLELNNLYVESFDFFNDLNSEANAVVFEDYIGSFYFSEATSDKILAAYREDIAALDAATLFNELPCGRLTMALLEDISDYDDTKAATPQQRAYNYCDYPLYASFTKTFAAMAAAGIDISFAQKISANDVSYIEVRSLNENVPQKDIENSVTDEYIGGADSATGIYVTTQEIPAVEEIYGDDWYYTEPTDSDIRVDTYTDKQSIEKFLNETYREDAFYITQFISYNDWPQVQVYMNSGSSANFYYPIYVTK